MLRSRKARCVGLVVAGACGLGATGTAHAATAQWSCGADVAKATIAGQSTLDPVTTAKAPCADGSSGLPNTTDAVGLAPSLNAQSAYAITSAKPATGKPIEQSVGAAAGAEGLSITAAGNVVLGVDAARSEVSAVCKDGGPSITGNSQVTGITLNGQKVTLDGPLTTLTDGLSKALGVIVTIKLNEQVATTKDDLVERAAHITVLPQAGGAPLADVIVAESRISSASACDPNADGNEGSDTSGSGGDGTLPTGLCPNGSQLDAARGVCVIAASASGGAGTIVIGRPYTGPSGGTVYSLPVARKKASSPCLSGSGPKYAILGTSKSNKITGTNAADRILGLAGNDQLDGGRGNDCIDGGTGSDSASGALGNDTVYGQAGNDHLNGGAGSDRLIGGSGNDTINSAFGGGLVMGGPGRDYINVATAGTPARVDCGSGKDKVRLNRNERKRTKGCEVSYVFNDK